MSEERGTGARGPERRGLVALLAVAAALGVALGSPPTSPFLHLLPCLPLVVAIALPDAPRAAGLAGASGAAVVLGRLALAGANRHHVVFVVLAFGATTTYGVLVAARHRAQRLRQARLEAERAAADAALAAERRGRARFERLAILGRLAAGVAHELANPLSAARANVAAAEERLAAGAGREDGELTEILTDVSASLARMRRTVEDLRAFSRDGASPPELCALEDLLTEATRLVVPRAPGAEIVLELPPDLPPLHVERRRVVQALLWVLAEAAGALGQPAACQLRVSARLERGEVVVVLEGRTVPAAPTTDDEVLRGVALALAREDLLNMGGGLRREVEGGATRLVVHVPVGAAQAPTPTPG